MYVYIYIYIYIYYLKKHRYQIHGSRSKRTERKKKKNVSLQPAIESYCPIFSPPQRRLKLYYSYHVLTLLLHPNADSLTHTPTHYCYASLYRCADVGTPTFATYTSPLPASNATRCGFSSSPMVMFCSSLQGPTPPLPAGGIARM